MNIYIGAEHIISPLGNTNETFNHIVNGHTAVKKHTFSGFNTPVYTSKFDASVQKKTLIQNCLKNLNIDGNIITSNKTKIIISSTKGLIDDGLEYALLHLIDLIKPLKPALTPLIISNACISGVLAVNIAANYIQSNIYDNVIVLGIDFVSDFVIAGFQSLYAIDDNICKPFDKDRKGINIGEACAAVVLSKNKNIFKNSPLLFLGGSSSNDANHISGPSRTGEGLYRTIKKALNKAKILPNEIEYISAHGTGTVYNDNMESIAFKRANISNAKMNSFKAYLGHTLGTAGVIETALVMLQLKHQTLIKSLGYEQQGTDEKLNIITQTHPASFNIALKTASGFGGGNASLILKKI